MKYVHFLSSLLAFERLILTRALNRLLRTRPRQTKLLRIRRLLLLVVMRNSLRGRKNLLKTRMRNLERERRREMRQNLKVRNPFLIC